MEKWFVLRKGADFQRISRKYHIDPVVARLIRNRDIIEDEEIDTYLNGTLDQLHDGLLMKDMDKAIAIISEKIQEGSSIRIIGDYDIDGVNATYILLEGIRELGGIVDVDIPDRMKDGYGLNEHLIDRALKCDIDTIITCDNGIAAAKEIAYAKSFGITVIVTDHHEVPYEEIGGNKQYTLPPADAVVNPKRVECEYPFKNLCGAAVAYKLVEALYNVQGKDVEDVDYLMENVAIATVGDVMDLVGENRIFVKQGLEMLKHTKNLGMQALMECAQIPVERLSTYHIGYVLGPCINASGRLDTAKRALELLTARSKSEAAVLAGDLKALNDSRKDMTAAGLLKAQELIETRKLKNQKILTVYLEECHESLAGIIAGRLRERYHKPSIVLTRGEEGIKGSGRSIEGYDMFEELSKCKHLFTKFGGHKMAAGLSLEAKHLEVFCETINQISTLTEEDFIPKVSIDMQMPLSYISEQLIDELELLEPFGKGNAKPLFVAKDVAICGMRVLGKNQNVLKFQLQETGKNKIEAIYFGDVASCMEYMKDKFGKNKIDNLVQGKGESVEMSFTYCPGINEYMGQKSMQIVVQNYQ